jgi:D-alanyl-D-alanine-carboxypeptidase/D-alanyl-D-alanine-endopeptidase
MFRSLSFSLLLAAGTSLSIAQSPNPVNLQAASGMGQELYELSGTTGMVLVIVHNDKVFIEGYGEDAPHSHQAPTKESVVRLCSLTKIFTSDLLTKLVLDHTLQLNDPLQKYAPVGKKVPERGGQPITLLELATHTAGLHREVGYPQDGAAHFTYPDHETRWDWLPQQQLRSKPGTIASYSNIGYDLLSDALEDAAHKPYPALLSERTLQPLGMWQTTYYPSEKQCKRLMASPQDDGACTITANTQGSSGLYSTPVDMARWLKYLLGTGGKGFPAQPHEAQDVYLTPDQLIRMNGLNYAGDPSGLGLGWVHVLPAGDPSHLVEKTGGGAGFLTYIALHPASHTAIFVAVTEGRKLPHVTHFNLFKASNSLLLNLVGAPPIPEEEDKPKAKLHKAVTAKGHAAASAAKPRGKTGSKPAARSTARRHPQPAARPAKKSHTAAVGKPQAKAVPHTKHKHVAS